MTLPLWCIPASLTVLIALAALYWPMQSRGGGYNFGQAIESAFHAVIGGVAALVVWLTFFIIV